MNYFEIFNPGYDFDNVMIEFILSDEKINYGMQPIMEADAELYSQLIQMEQVTITTKISVVPD